jgi:hypothetical protein
MSVASRIARQLAKVAPVRAETCVFVQMDGAHAVVNVGDSTITVPVVGWVPPASGMTVQMEWRAGSAVVTGPAKALSPFGVITSAGTPQSTVEVGGVEYMLYLRDGYTPTLGDPVTVNWMTGIIEGKITGATTPDPPPTSGGSGGVLDPANPVRAIDSGRYQTSWWGNDPWASSSNDGIWVYGSRVRDFLRGGNVATIEIYLPLQSQLGLCQIGLHPHASIPGGAPSITSLVDLPLGSRAGWVRLPDSWGNWLRDNDGGIGVLAPGGAGMTKWTGTRLDGSSGALRFTGIR